MSFFLIALLRDSHRFSAGVSLFPTGKAEKVSDLFTYHAGGYFEQSYLGGNLDVNEWGLSAGLSIPLPYKGNLQIIYERNFRGSTNNSLVQENYHQITFGFSFYDMAK